jgi:membrane-associated phospholipid phosphatase
MALNSTDKLLAAYLAFVTVLIVARGLLSSPLGWWLLVMHVLFGSILLFVTRARLAPRIGDTLHILYPLLLLIPFYWEIGAIGSAYGIDRVLAHDTVVQEWEARIFGEQISYVWIRQYPSVFWSTVLHLAYFTYYAVIVLGPVLSVAHGRRDAAKMVLFSMMIAYVMCYVVFLAYPVAGPYYTFPGPEGPVREVWSAHLVYSVLSAASSFGTAFPSSHVAATVATTYALWFGWRRLAAWFIVPTILLTVGTVYCQMHYGVDAILGVLVGLLAGSLGRVALRHTPGFASGIPFPTSSTGSRTTF